MHGKSYRSIFNKNNKNCCRVIDDNRKLFIGKELEKHFGINLETKDVTHVYDVSEEDQMVKDKRMIP